MNKKLLSLYGLKWNPFSPELPTEALYVTPKVDHFRWRIENSLIHEGGFALITGEPGTGKSVALRLLDDRLASLRDVTVGALTHPQSNLADFYRELGDVFGVALRPHNRWGGFKALRERWLAHLDSTLCRPVLLVDEAQVMNNAVLSELRMLASVDFDSRHILSVVLSGDQRLQSRLRDEELLPLGSRIRVRLGMDYASREELRGCFEHLLDNAGNRKLMTPELIDTVCEHAMGNYRVLTTMAAELLAAAAERELARLDEKLYLEVFSPPQKSTPPQSPKPARRRRR
jgi:type II secretory pathway predicted ATPase ExeA